MSFESAWDSSVFGDDSNKALRRHNPPKDVRARRLRCHRRGLRVEAGYKPALCAVEVVSKHSTCIGGPPFYDFASTSEGIGCDARHPDPAIRGFREQELLVEVRYSRNSSLPAPAFAIEALVSIKIPS